jgi:hypothetical protein
MNAYEVLREFTSLIMKKRPHPEMVAKPKGLELGDS